MAIYFLDDTELGGFTGRGIMNKKHIGIIAIASVIVICTASIGYIAYSGVWRDWVAGEWKNSYDFSISFGTTENLYNVTLYLPILMVNDEVDSLMFEIDYPSNWTWNITDTEYGKMLKISTDIMPAGGCRMEIVNKVANHLINAKNPVGNEPVLYPRLNETSVKHGEMESAKYEYTSKIYAEYNASSENLLNIEIWVGGGKIRPVLNAYDASSYGDKIDCFVNGSGIWYTVNGTLKIMWT